MQPCPKPSKVGFIIYNTQSLLIHELVNNVVKITKKSKVRKLKHQFNQRPRFRQKSKSRNFYKNFKHNDQTKRLSHVHRKVPKVYTTPCCRHIKVIQLLSGPSSHPDKRSNKWVSTIVCSCSRSLPGISTSETFPGIYGRPISHISHSGYNGANYLPNP